MKKTLRTVLTAAMFAAANMSALPTSAEELAAESVKTAENEPKLVEIETVQQEEAAKTVTTTTTPPLPTMLFTTTTAPQPLYGPVMSMSDFGDLNLDEQIDIFDEVALRKMLINGLEFSSYDNFRKIHNADINQDDKVNIADLILLRKFLLGKIDSFDIDRSKMMMLGKTIDIISSDDKEDPVVTTETSVYDPREDIVVSLYGIRPAKDIIDQAIWQTKENIDTEISSEEENK